MSRTLVIGDIHEPVCHPGYLQFCLDLQDQWECDTVVFIGDVVDLQAISFHAHHPECPGPADEYTLAKAGVSKWHAAFPEARVCIGNHDQRPLRLAQEVGIPARFLREYADIWGTPGWDWQDDHIVDDVYYFHGTGNGGEHPAYNAAKKMLMSTVMGHIHTAGGVKWMVSPTRRIFGMDTGCGIDDRAFAFAYGKHTKRRSVISAGVVIDGVPYHEICGIGPGEAYHRDKFVSKKRRKR